jgi:predicted ABC-type ATPase
VKRAALKPEEAWKPSGLDNRPVIIALAGPNGAGKSTFYEVHLKPTGLRFLNADLIARELETDPYRASEVVAKLRAELVQLRESFIFETVFSDPVGDKLLFLKQAAQSGYTVILCFIGIESPELSETRVAMRVSQGGHDVPREKLVQRFPRILTNLRRALRELPRVLVFNNDDLDSPFRHVADYQNGKPVFLKPPVPSWLKPIL